MVEKGIIASTGRQVKKLVFPPDGPQLRWEGRKAFRNIQTQRIYSEHVNLKHDWQNLLLISFFHVILWLETKRLVWTIGIAVISNLRLSLRFCKKSFSFHDLNGCRYIFSFWLFILAGFITRQQSRTHQLTRMEILLLQSSWMKQRGKNTKQNLGRLINGLFPVCKSFNWKKARKNSTMALNR